LLKKVAAQKRVTIHGLEGRSIGIHGDNARGQPFGSIEVHENGERVGGISYAILHTDVIVTQLRRRDVTEEVPCISIGGFNVTKTGEGLGSLLLALALFVGLANGCAYSVLDDMSDRHNKLKDNIYAKFGFTHKDLIVIKNETVEKGNGPEKQLELPNADQMLKNFQAEFKMEGGKRTRKERFMKRRKSRKTKRSLNSTSSR
jgi:hypothetical protein